MRLQTINAQRYNELTPYIVHIYNTVVTITLHHGLNHRQPFKNDFIN